MLLVVVAAVLAVRILLSLLRPRKRSETNVKGRAQRPGGTRRTDEIEDADFREIKE
ncbi:MAG: hypothetical protein IPG71_14210 [bacterium]|nr:hypothetical protein [bacterium]